MKFIYSYINNRKQRVRINESVTKWSENVLQGSTLGPLLFILFPCNLFYFEEYIDTGSYADSNTPYGPDSNINKTISSLESSSARLFNWFQQNAVESNPDKCHLLLNTNQNKLANINTIAHNTSSEKSLGSPIDTNLQSDIHVNNLCKKVYQKLNALTRIASLIHVDKR